MKYAVSFPQADNLELVYQVFIDLTEEGLNRYSFSEKYGISDRQGAYYLNALCFIGVAEKKDKNTYLNNKGKAVQMLEEPFRKKVFQLAIYENQFICDTYQRCKGKTREEKKEIACVEITGTYGINDATLERRARTLLRWFSWFDQQDYLIEEIYNE